MAIVTDKSEARKAAFTRRKLAHEAGQGTAGAATPLRFRIWEPGCLMIAGEFGAQIPESGDWMEPEIVIVPLVAFDRNGGRLGYGGGFYDRTLEMLRAKRPTLAIGFAYEAQEDAGLSLEQTDQPLDLIVTEAGVLNAG